MTGVGVITCLPAFVVTTFTKLPLPRVVTA